MIETEDGASVVAACSSSGSNMSKMYGVVASKCGCCSVCCARAEAALSCAEGVLSSAVRPFDAENNALQMFSAG